MAYKRKDAGGGGREKYGNFVINAPYTHRIYSPKSDDAGKVTEIKIFASVDPTDGKIMPQVVPVDGSPLEGISDAFHAAEFISFLGEKKYQYICDTSDFPDKAESPTSLFVNKLKDFVENEGKRREPDWADWLEWQGGAQSPACVMMVQGVLIKHNGEVMKNNAGKEVQIAPILMTFSRSATTAMEDKLTTPVDPSKPISAVNSEIGDITDPQKGRTLIIDSYNNADNRKRYSVSAGREFPLDEQYVKAQFIPWDKLLKVETAEWQIKRLVETFDARSVDMALSDDPDYGVFVPPNVRGAFSGKTMITVPASAPTAAAVTPQATTVAPSPQTTETVSSPAPAEQAPLAVNIASPDDLDGDDGEVDLASNPVMQALQAEKEASRAQ